MEIGNIYKENAIVPGGSAGLQKITNYFEQIKETLRKIPVPTTERRILWFIKIRTRKKPEDLMTEMANYFNNLDKINTENLQFILECFGEIKELSEDYTNKISKISKALNEYNESKKDEKLIYALDTLSEFVGSQEVSGIFDLFKQGLAKGTINEEEREAVVNFIKNYIESGKGALELVKMSYKTLMPALLTGVNNQIEIAAKRDAMTLAAGIAGAGATVYGVKESQKNTENKIMRGLEALQDYFEKAKEIEKQEENFKKFGGKFKIKIE